jgi:hypothetical protein
MSEHYDQVARLGVANLGLAVETAPTQTKPAAAG